MSYGIKTYVCSACLDQGCNVVTRRGKHGTDIAVAVPCSECTSGYNLRLAIEKGRTGSLNRATHEATKEKNTRLVLLGEVQLPGLSRRTGKEAAFSDPDLDFTEPSRLSDFPTDDEIIPYQRDKEPR